MKELWELFIVFAKIGGFTFGGGYAMLPILQREVVENRNWATSEELMDYYAIGQCTPGVIAVNTSTYIGYQQGKLVGSIFATLGMISPSLIIITLIASILKEFMALPIVLHALAGIRITVCALMLNTVFSLMKSGIKDKLGVLLFLFGFLLATFTPIPTILLVVCAAVIGIFVKLRKERV